MSEQFAINLLHYFFSSHFHKLGQNTRPKGKWIQDNLLHVDTWINKKYLSLDRIIKSINKKRNNFVYWHSSPAFNTSFSWYKKRNVKAKVIKIRGINKVISIEGTDNLLILAG